MFTCLTVLVVLALVELAASFAFSSTRLHQSRAVIPNSNSVPKIESMSFSTSISSSITRLAATLQGAETQTTTTDGNGKEDPALVLASRFELAWYKALQGKLDELSALMPDVDAEWDSPVGGTLKDIKEGFVSFSEFMEQPALTVFKTSTSTEDNQNRIIFEYQISFTYPLPWKPRVIIPGRATVCTNAEHTQITSVKEEWEVTVRR